MRLRTHLLTSSALGLALYPRRPERLAALVAAGTLIDLDHLVLYALRTGDWSAVGALRYNRYRGRRYTAGDTRPRYGSLRSWLHNPWLALPLAWAWAGACPAARPLALGRACTCCSTMWTCRGACRPGCGPAGPASPAAVAARA